MNDVSLLVVCLNVINTVSHLLLGAVSFAAFYAINISSQNVRFTKLSAHVYLVMIGYMILMSQAILSLNPHSGWESNFKYPQKKKMYWQLQILGSALAFIGGVMGIAAIAELRGIGQGWFVIRHFDTTHGVIGFITLLLTSVSLVGACVHLVLPNKMDRFIMKALQYCAGTFVLVFAIIAMCVSFNDAKNILSSVNGNLAISFAVLALVGMLTMLGINFKMRGRDFVM